MIERGQASFLSFSLANPLWPLSGICTEPPRYRKQLTGHFFSKSIVLCIWNQRSVHCQPASPPTNPYMQVKIERNSSEASCHVTQTGAGKQTLTQRKFQTCRVYPPGAEDWGHTSLLIKFILLCTGHPRFLARVPYICCTGGGESVD